MGVLRPTRRMSAQTSRPGQSSGRHSPRCLSSGGLAADALGAVASAQRLGQPVSTDATVAREPDLTEDPAHAVVVRALRFDELAVPQISAAVA